MNAVPMLGVRDGVFDTAGEICGNAGSVIVALASQHAACEDRSVYVTCAVAGAVDETVGIMLLPTVFIDHHTVFTFTEGDACQHHSLCAEGGELFLA